MYVGVHLSCVPLLGVFSNPQEVAVKEQLTGKGKLNRRSISSPSMNRVSPSCCHCRAGTLLASCLDASLPPCKGSQLSVTSLCWFKCLCPFPYNNCGPSATVPAVGARTLAWVKWKHIARLSSATCPAHTGKPQKCMELKTS